MMQRRDLLTRNPVSFDELLDLFEAYTATIGAPLDAAADLIRDQFNYNHGDIFGHIFGTKANAHDMTVRLKQIRATRSASADVTLTLTEQEANQAEVVTSEVEHLFTQAAHVFELLHTGLASRHLDPEAPGVLAVLELARRAMMSAAEHEGEAMTRLGDSLRKAKSYQHPQQEDAA
ncbi:hypothetical protein [Pseudorhodobacter sp.]|uniref:hypothetical protein n=1 Tax=Pseudorhodobacter sp. TaxID=1934400 RepID=UPI002AFDCB8A|nr:hypothetical protein [Pseudorhodobacter sp.]